MSDPLVVPKEVIQWMREFVDRSDHLVTMPTPKTTLVDRMVEASRRSGFGDSAEDGMVRALAVVRAEVDHLSSTRGIALDDWVVRKSDVLELLGGGSDA